MNIVDTILKRSQACICLWKIPELVSASPKWPTIPDIAGVRLKMVAFLITIKNHFHCCKSNVFLMNLCIQEKYVLQPHSPVLLRKSMLK